MGPEERRFSVRGLELAALEWPGEGLPVIALHGWLDNAASFIPLAAALEGVHILAPDMVGHGRSGHLPEAAAYHLSDYFGWAVALADALGWERFVLLGHSMGAAAATLGAAALPQRVAGLILLDGISPLALTPGQELQRLRQLFRSAPRKAPRVFDSIESAVLVRQRLGRFPISRTAAGLLTERGMVAVEGGYRWSHDERLQRPSSHYYSAEQAEGILRGIETDTLLITASEGAFRGWEGFAARKACLRSVTHVELPGQHHFHMDEPERVAAQIMRYLGRDDGGARCC